MSNARVHLTSRSLASRATAVMALIVTVAAFACIHPHAAFAWTAGQALPNAFPRTSVWWPDPTTQSVSAIAKHDMVVLQNRYASSVPTLKKLHPDMLVLNTTSACELFLDSSASPPSWANVEISRVPNAWILTQVGSKLTATVNSTSNLLYVSSTSAFRVGDVVVIEDELAKVVGINTNSILVIRGLVPRRSPATAHASGTRVAAVVCYWPGTVVMDVSTYCPKVTVDSAIGPETWTEYNARKAISMLSTGDWDGILLDRSDSNLSGVADGPYTRTIDSKRTNTLPTDGYAALESAWADGLRIYESRIRAKVGKDKLLLGNWAHPHLDLLNGTIMETFPRTKGGSAGATWRDVVFGTQNMIGRSYLTWTSSALQPNLTTVQTYESDSSPADGDDRYINPTTIAGWHPDYRKVRFGLATALLGDGFFDYELNTAGHATLGMFWFDEYDNAGRGAGYLGKPLGAARLALPALTSADLVGGSGTFSTAEQVNRWTVSARTGYALTRAYDASTARVDVTTSAGVANQASFYYRSVAVKAGTPYTLTFRAKGDAATKITARVAKATSPYTAWLYVDPIDVGTNWQTYELALPASGSDSAAYLIFGVGSRVGTIWFDSVKLQQGSRLDVYRRDFERGSVVVNATSTSKSVPLGATFRKIKGTQAPTVNDGKYVSSVTLPTLDALVLLRTPTLSFGTSGTITPGTTRTLSGTLKNAVGVVVSSATVTLQHSYDKVNWTSTGTGTTSTTGAFSFAAKPSRTTYYRVRYYGSTTELEATSSTVAVTVAAS